MPRADAFSLLEYSVAHLEGIRAHGTHDRGRRGLGEHLNGIAPGHLGQWDLDLEPVEVPRCRVFTGPHGGFVLIGALDLLRVTLLKDGKHAEFWPQPQYKGDYRHH